MTLVSKDLYLWKQMQNWEAEWGRLLKTPDDIIINLACACVRE